MKTSTTQKLTRAAIIGSLYTALSLLGSIFGISFGAIQCRFSEALCVLPFFFPESIWGLFVGCLISNLLSPYGLLDLFVGSLTTLLAAFLTSKCRKKSLAPLPPVLLNGLFIGALVSFEEVGFGPAFLETFWFNCCSVAVGEALACYLLGSLILYRLPKVKYFKNLSKKY